MRARSDEFRIRRIRLALDSFARDPATLQAAARLAERLRAEIDALFVEDINLLRSAEFPFARGAGGSIAGSRDFNAAAMERELKAAATELRRALAAEAERSRLSWTFRVVRGHPESEAFAATEDIDLVVLARAPEVSGPRLRLASPAREATGKATRSVLLLRAVQALDQGVNAVYDGSPGAERALAAALTLAGEGDLRVLVVAESQDQARELEAAAAKRLEGSGHAAAFETLIAPSTARLCEVAREAGGVLVVSAQSPLVSGDAAAQCLDRADCPILLVR